MNIQNPETRTRWGIPNEFLSDPDRVSLIQNAVDTAVGTVLLDADQRVLAPLTICYDPRMGQVCPHCQEHIDQLLTQFPNATKLYSDSTLAETYIPNFTTAFGLACRAAIREHSSATVKDQLIEPQNLIELYILAGFPADIRSQIIDKSFASEKQNFALFGYDEAILDEAVAAGFVVAGLNEDDLRPMLANNHIDFTKDVTPTTEIRQRMQYVSFLQSMGIPYDKVKQLLNQMDNRGNN